MAANVMIGAGVFRHYSDLTLTVLLCIGAGVILLLAFQKDRPVLKAAALAYIVFP